MPGIVNCTACSVKGWVCASLSDLQVHAFMCCFVPDGDEHSFPWAYECQKNMFWDMCNVVLFCVGVCLSSLDSTCDANIVMWSRHMCAVSKPRTIVSGVASSCV